MNPQNRPSIWNLVAKDSKPIVRLAGRGGGTPIYLVHGVAGDIGFYQQFAEMLADARAVYGIQAPSHKINAAFASSISGLAEYYVDALTAFQPEGPVMLGGWSAGSTIALEMAQILKRRGREVPLLISFDGILYHTGARVRAWSPRYISAVLGNMRHWVNDAREQRLGTVCSFRRLWRDWKLLLACSAIERNARGDVTDTFLEEAVWPAKRLPFIRSLFIAIERYRPEAYDGRVLVYLAQVQPFFHSWQVDACWAHIAPSADFHSIPSMHDDLFHRHAREMGSHLRQYLPEMSKPSKAALDHVAGHQAGRYMQR